MELGCSGGRLSVVNGGDPVPVGQCWLDCAASCRPGEVRNAEVRPEEVRPLEVRPWFDRVAVDFHGLHATGRPAGLSISSPSTPSSGLSLVVSYVPATT